MKQMKRGIKMKNGKIMRKIIAFVLAVTCVISGGILAKAEAAPDVPAAASADKAVINIYVMPKYNQFSFGWTSVPGAVKYTGYYINNTQGISQYFTVEENDLISLVWLSIYSRDDIWVAVSAQDADGNTVGYGEQHFNGSYPYPST